MTTLPFSRFSQMFSRKMNFQTTTLKNTAELGYFTPHWILRKSNFTAIGVLSVAAALKQIWRPNIWIRSAFQRRRRAEAWSNAFCYNAVVERCVLEIFFHFPFQSLEQNLPKKKYICLKTFSNSKNKKWRTFQLFLEIWTIIF